MTTSRPAGAGDPVDALAAQQAELIDLVADLGEDELAITSRCDHWSLADVLLHLAQSNEMASASLRGRLAEHVSSVTTTAPAPLGIESWVEMMVEVERSTSTVARDRYMESASTQEAAFRSVDPGARVLWAAGDMSARSLATTRLTETWIHACDVATGMGVRLAPTARLWHTAHLVWRTVPYAAGRGRSDDEPAIVRAVGDVAFDLIGTDGDRWILGDPSTATIVVQADAVELCEVAGQRRDVSDSSLRAQGQGGSALLARLRTFV